MPLRLLIHIAQQVAADHAVLHAAKHGGDDIAAIVAIGTGERAQVTKITLGFSLRDVI